MKVMVATDGSDAARRAASEATRFLHPDAQIELVAVIPERHDPEDDAGGFEGPVITDAEADADWDRAVATGRKALADTQAAMRADAGAETTLLPSDAAPGAAIVLMAKDHQVDLLVLGASESGFFHRLLGGSVTDHVVHHAPCPLLIVPAPQ
ncbi:MAG TPA: universal stress protein [Acidimicrobiales bacterium]